MGVRMTSDAMWEWIKFNSSKPKQLHSEYLKYSHFKVTVDVFDGTGWAVLNV
jgi:hypothetical protein